MGKCTNTDCPKFRCPVCRTSIVSKANLICDNCTKTCDNCGRSPAVPYESLSLDGFTGAHLCEDCADALYTNKEVVCEICGSETTELIPAKFGTDYKHICLSCHKTNDLFANTLEPETQYECNVCGDYFSLQIPYNGRTICEKCILEHSEDLQECINCEESFYPELPEQETCNQCLKKCVQCGTKYWRNDNSPLCDHCSEVVVCANCGELTPRSEISEQGYCENCSGRMMIPNCVVQYCNKPANSAGYCIEHRTEYKKCPVCDDKTILKTDIICDACANQQSG